MKTETRVDGVPGVGPGDLPRPPSEKAARVYYEDEAVTLYLGNCMTLLGPMCGVDHVITDPPYESEAHTLQRRRSAEYGNVITVDPLEFPPIRPWERAYAMDAFASLARRWVLVFCQIEGAPLWRASGEMSGLVYKRTCLWVKPDAMPQLTGDRPGTGYEAFVAMHRPGRSQWNAGGRHGVYVVSKRAENLEHPTQKPVSLFVELVRDFTDEGDTILDPFAGSGTTLIAAKLNGRKAIGIEQSEKFCEVAAKRLQQTEPGRLFDKLPKAKPGAFSFSDAVDPVDGVSNA